MTTSNFTLTRNAFGQLVFTGADGEAHEVVCHSPAFAPQVSKVLSPAPWLTVDEVADALAGATS